MKWRELLYRLRDFIFPVAEPLSKAEQEKPETTLRDLKEGLPWDTASLGEYTAAAEMLLNTEYARKQGIEARLTSLLGMSSIAGTVGTLGLFLGTGGISRIQTLSLRWLLTVTGCYLILQICAAMINAVRGLSRRPYSHPTILDLVRAPEESQQGFLRRKAACMLDVLSDNESQNNRKLTYLSIAHCALKNFLWGLLVFTVIGAVALFRLGSADDVVDRLRKDHALNELLRGPQGVAGPKGDPGLPCKAHTKKPCPP